MNQILVDTGAWDAIVDSADSNHGPALLFQDDIAGQYNSWLPIVSFARLYTGPKKGIMEANATGSPCGRKGKDRLDDADLDRSRGNCRVLPQASY